MSTGGPSKPAAAAATATAAAPSAIPNRTPVDISATIVSAPSKPNQSDTVLYFQSAPVISQYKPPVTSRCCHRRSYYARIANVVNGMESLLPVQKDIMHERYITLLHSYYTRSRVYSAAFHGLRLIVTVGSLLVPALLSVQQIGSHKDSIYWFTWALSLAVTMSNGALTLFKVEKKYYYLHTAYELMHTEGWQFISLTGKYGAHGSLRKEGTPAFTHQTAFEHFCHYVEKLKIRQVDDEYYKSIDAARDATPAADSSTSSEGAAKSMMNLQTPGEKTVADLAARIVRTAPKETLDQLKEFTDMLARPGAGSGVDAGKSKQ